MPTPITRHYWHFSLRRNLLAQYLWRDYLKGIAVGCAVLLAIFLLAQVIIVLPIVIQSGFQWSVLLRIIVFYIPQALVIIFPLVLSIGVFIIMRKQLDNHELLIARGFGVSERQLLQIINALAMLGFVILLLLKGYLTPWSQKAYRDVQLRASQNIVRAFLEEGRFFSPAPGFTIFIGKKNLGGLLEDIFIMDRRQ
ncbi:MAG: LptF/LptG family permease, partial [Alphaproteobacteria bacterium]|nr:LptF/LptG family permease [Alphaproteobacteria bacterium]